MSNEKFKVKFGLAVGDDALTIDAATGDIVTQGNINSQGDIVLNGSSSGSINLKAPAVAGSQTYTLPGAYPVTTGYVLSSTTSGTLSWVDNPDTTYTISADITTGGANLTLLNNWGSPDQVKFASGGQTTVTRSSADTITISSTSTTYTQNASTATGGANLNLVGSDSTTDTIKFADGIGVTVTRTDADTITLNIGQDVSSGDSPSFSGIYLNGNLRMNGSSSGSTTISAGASPATITYTLPSSAPSVNGQVLASTTTGTLSWATASGGGSTLPISNSGTISARPYSLGPGVLALNGTFATLSVDMTQTIRYQPIYVTETCTLTEVAVWQQTGTTLASCNAMIYIEECSPNSATEWQPTGHLSGGYCGELTFSSTASPVLKNITGLSISLTPGAYLIAMQISNYTGTLGLRYLAGQVFTGGGYVVDLASGTTSAQASFGRTGVAYVSGTPAAVGDFTNITPNNLSGVGYFVMTKFAKA